MVLETKRCMLINNSRRSILFSAELARSLFVSFSSLLDERNDEKPQHGSRTQWSAAAHELPDGCPKHGEPAPISRPAIKSA